MPAGAARTPYPYLTGLKVQIVADNKDVVVLDFEIALDRAGVSADQCVYVGDNYYDDAIGSRAVGMQALIINRFGKLGVEEIDDCPIIQHISQICDYTDICRSL